MRRRKAPQPMPPPLAGGPVTRRRKLAELERPPVDRISALPDELIGEIIRLLPIQDGARTQALASRWRHIWRSTPLDMDCCDLLYSAQGSYTSDVSPVVSRILSAHAGPVRRFCARTDSTHGTMDYTCFHSATMDALEELEFAGLRKRLPSSIFRFSATLRVASIADCDIPDDIVQGLHFPRLKQLGLECVHVSDSSLHGLIAGCPSLEFLMVKSSSGFRRLRINSLTLRSICVRINEPEASSAKLQFEKLVIENAPSLERLIHLYKHCWGMEVSVLSAPTIETLYFLSDWQNLRTRVCGSIQGLRVDSPNAAVHTVKSIAVNMKNLSLDSIVDLMRLFPCLEKLHLKSRVSWETNCWLRKHRRFINCHDIRLKTLVLEPYLGSLSHINFATFFVLNARLLELMKFQIPANVYNDDFLAEQHSKLQLRNKASSGARFHFTTGSFQHDVWGNKHLRDFDLHDPFLCGC